MYENLVKIGLGKYLDEYYDSKEWVSETYMRAIDAYVGLKTKQEQNILRKKFKRITNHSEVNDHFNELMIGTAYHPEGVFQEDNVTGGSPDLIDNSIPIEVKSINAPPKEIERQKTILFDVAYSGPLPDDGDFENRFAHKFHLRLERARNQIGNSGLVYIVWNSTIKGWSDRKNEIKKVLDKLVSEHKKEYPEITIKHIFFGDLRELVVTRAFSKKNVK